MTTQTQISPAPADRLFGSVDAREELAGRILKYGLIIFFILITVFPFYWMLTMSVRPFVDVVQNPARIFPTGDQLSNFWNAYQTVLVDFKFLNYIGNSLIISLTTVTLTLLLSIPGAYAITRLRFGLRSAMNWGLLLVYLFPAIVIGIPLFVVYSQLGVRASAPLPGIIVVYMSQTIPVSLYMLRSYFQTLPAELEEAALIDGCTHLSTIYRIVVPISIPAVASVALYTFMIAWNEFLFALLFLVDSPGSWTLPLGLQQLDKAQEVPTTVLMAGSVIVSVPVIALFFFFERFLTRGLTAGAIKG